MNTPINQPTTALLVDDGAPCRDERKRAAIHEAGHAVVASKLGIRFSDVEISDSNSGVFRLSEPDLTHRLDDQILTRAAGALAEWRYLGYPRGGDDLNGDRRSPESAETYWALLDAWSDDWRAIERDVLEGDLRPARYVRRLVERAAELVQDWFPEIKRVADELMRKGKLTAVEVDHLCGAVAEAASAKSSSSSLVTPAPARRAAAKMRSPRWRQCAEDRDQ